MHPDTESPAQPMPTPENPLRKVPVPDNTENPLRLTLPTPERAREIVHANMHGHKCDEDTYLASAILAVLAECGVEPAEPVAIPIDRAAVERARPVPDYGNTDRYSDSATRHTAPTPYTPPVANPVQSSGETRTEWARWNVDGKVPEVRKADGSWVELRGLQGLGATFIENLVEGHRAAARREALEEAANITDSYASDAASAQIRRAALATPPAPSAPTPPDPGNVANQVFDNFNTITGYYMGQMKTSNELALACAVRLCGREDTNEAKARLRLEFLCHLTKINLDATLIEKTTRSVIAELVTGNREARPR